jgi:hypothetical protein
VIAPAGRRQQNEDWGWVRAITLKTVVSSRHVEALLQHSHLSLQPFDRLGLERIVDRPFLKCGCEMWCPGPMGAHAADHEAERRMNNVISFDASANNNVLNSSSSTTNGRMILSCGGRCACSSPGHRVPVFPVREDQSP